MHIAEVGVTQCRTLAQAEQQVRDCFETLQDRHFDTAAVRISVDLKGIEDDIEAVKAETKSAADAQIQAGAHRREVARRLRAEGISVSDIASLLGVSRGRVSQILEGDGVVA